MIDCDYPGRKDAKCEWTPWSDCHYTTKFGSKGQRYDLFREYNQVWMGPILGGQDVSGETTKFESKGQRCKLFWAHDQVRVKRVPVRSILGAQDTLFEHNEVWIKESRSVVYLRNKKAIFNDPRPG